MTTLCSGKLLDKLRYLFSNLADTNGHMISERFGAFLRDVGRIASAVGEEKQRDVSNLNCGRCCGHNLPRYISYCGKALAIFSASLLQLRLRLIIKANYF